MSESGKDKASSELLAVSEWHNEDNNLFYETVKVNGLKSLAEIAGLSACCDLDLLQPYWSKAESILDIGAGYGRAVDYLLTHGFQGQITAVERCNVMFEYLEKNFGQDKNVNLLHCDIRCFTNTHKNFDLVLLLWSGIADFTKTEQIAVFSKARSLLEKGGTLILDIIPHDIQPMSSEYIGDGTYVIPFNGVNGYVYLPEPKAIEASAKTSGFLSIDLIHYATDTKRKRCVYIIK